MTFSSPAFTADAITLTRTSAGPGVGFGTSVISTPSPGLALVAVIWASTATLQVPRHRELLHGFDPGSHRRLLAGS